MHLDKHKHLSINLLCVICDRDKHEKVGSILAKHETLFCLMAYGKGVANSKTLSILGLGESEKVVVFSILATNRALEATADLDTSLQFSKPGHGIVFTTNINQGCYHRPVEFVGDADGGKEMQKDSPYDLIIVVLNRGYSEEVMDVARASGAKGGTVLHARSYGTAGMEKFFGVTITPEKEMLMILAQADASCGIMAGIADKVGPETAACAISFSLPVNHAKGIRESSQK